MKKFGHRCRGKMIMRIQQRLERCLPDKECLGPQAAGKSKEGASPRAS